MERRPLFIFVEGEDDERFFSTVVVPLVRDRYTARIVKWRRMRKEKIENYLRSAEGMGAEYIFVADIDTSKSVREKKRKIKKEVRNIKMDRIAVVVREIESWYLAGLDKDAERELRIPHFERTDELTKEKFDSIMPERFAPRRDFMVEILKRFSVEVAERKNGSFREFMEKFVK
ncbi:MAG: hypothetical protein DRN40_06750 [Thermoplasmata archaeon]|nr:MAG: hypothetical protein DRN40_06750 [Thermoplasmata archaeon]